MTTLITDAELNADADRQAGAITHFSLHIDTPGVDGSNEAIGGDPAYIRMAATFTAAGAEGILGGTLQPATVGIAWSDDVTFDVDAGTYSYWGSWDDVSAGTFKRGNTVDVLGTPTPQVLSSQGQVKLSVGIGPVAGA